MSLGLPSKSITPVNNAPWLSLIWLILVTATAGLLFSFVGLTFETPNSVNGVIPLFVVVSSFGLVLWAAKDLRQFRNLRQWFFLLFLIRLLIAINHHHLYWADGKALFDRGLTQYDAFRYDASAFEVVKYGWQDAQITVDQWGIVAFYTIIYGVFGHNPLFPILFNTLLGALTSVFVYKIALPATTAHVAGWSALATMVSPETVFYGGVLMKEMLVMFLFFGTLWIWQRFQTKRSWLNLVMFGLCLYALRETRLSHLIIILGVVALSMIKYWRFALKRIIPFAALGLFIVFIATTGQSNFVRGANVFSLDYLLARRVALDDAASQLAANKAEPSASIGLRLVVDPTVPATYVFIPFRVLTFYLVPPFWMWGTEPDFMPYQEIGSLLVWLGFPAVMWGMWQLIKKKQTMLWLAFALSTLVISVATPFADARLKVAILPLFYLVAMIGFSQFHRWRQLYIPYGVAIILMAISYYTLKGVLGAM